MSAARFSLEGTFAYECEEKRMSVSTKKRGDLKTIREKLSGPIKVYLDSDERDGNGQIIVEEILYPDGSTERRNKREAEPFLEEVYYRKHFMTPAVEDQMKALRDNDAFKDRTLNLSVHTLVTLIAKWDLMDNGKPVPVTVEGILNADVPSEVIYSVMTAYYEATRPPKELSDRSQNTFSQEE